MTRAEALDALRTGAVVLLDTDTLPGLHARADIPGAPERIAALKGHPPERPYLLLLPDAERALALGMAAGPEREEELRRLWPAPVTALLAPREGVPAGWTDRGRTVAVRVPDEQTLRRFLEEVGAPLLSTSANRAGAAPARDLAAAAAAFPQLAVLDLGFEPRGAASALVDYSVEPPKLIRPVGKA